MYNEVLHIENIFEVREPRFPLELIGKGLGGWYAVERCLNKPKSFPLHEFSEYEMNKIGRASAYRWHLLAPIPFKDFIQVTVEHETNNIVEANYRSIAFYYLQNKKY